MEKGRAVNKKALKRGSGIKIAFFEDECKASDENEVLHGRLYSS